MTSFAVLAFSFSFSFSILSFSFSIVFYFLVLVLVFVNENHTATVGTVFESRELFSTSKLFYNNFVNCCKGQT